jgi:hypothetical protein
MKRINVFVVLVLLVLLTACSYGRKGELLQQALDASSQSGGDYMTLTQAKMMWGDPVQVVEDPDGSYINNVKIPQWVREGVVRPGVRPPASPKGYLIAKFSDRYSNEISTTNTIRGPMSGRNIQLTSPISSSHGCAWYVYFTNDDLKKSIMMDFGEEGQEDCYD